MLQCSRRSVSERARACVWQPSGVYYTLGVGGNGSGGGFRGGWGGRGGREGNARGGREGLGHRFAAAWVRVRAAFGDE